MRAGNNPDRPLPSESTEWLADHPEVNGAELEEMWRLSGLADEEIELDRGRVTEIRAVLNNRVKGVGGSGFAGSRRMVRWAVAASVLIAASAFWIAHPVRYEAPPGKMLSVMLPDGSKVDVNSGSVLERNRLFGWKSREVRLRGEAYFDVVSERGVFRVVTFNSQVEVLGTRFNVRSREDEPSPRTDVSVDEGRVGVSQIDEHARRIVLSAGQSARVAGGTVRVHEVSRGEAASWKAGGMVFSNVPLKVILDEITRRHQVEVAVTPDSLERLLVSVHMARAVDPGTILELVAGAHELNVTRTPSGYMLRRSR